MKNKITLAFLLIFLLSGMNTLQGQDAAFVGWNSDGPDGFALVALTNIPSSKNIFVTDLPYLPGSNSYDESGSTTIDGVVRVTWSGTWMKGTIIRVVETSSNTFTVDVSTNGPSSPGVAIVYGGDNFSHSNVEGLTVFTSNSITDPAANVTEIFGYLTNNASHPSADPNPNTDGDCPCSSDFVAVDFNNDAVDDNNFTPGLRSGAVSLADFNSTGSYTTSGSHVTLDLTEFTNITFGPPILPIELSSFTVKNIDNINHLNWITSSEINNEKFLIERSKDGRTFEAIGEVEGVGNSFQMQEYAFFDKFPYTGLNYYRLRQVDYDGKEEVHKVVSVMIDKEGESIQISPNPGSDIISLRLDKPALSEVNIKLLDINGRLVAEYTIEARSIRTEMNVSTLAKGMYILQIQKGQNVENQRFMKN